ncbi:MAG: 16S rRNA (adenine(1518)-N(6)/adenine(1519)-N(6))-dimethyltransferase RsmA [Holosporales bacterium]|nr:16S rRNA (adenine(1518)-N(6)/adenine(1519)-N(6))-dimethyltransferase RsmA [Holosporales bacterium]
MELGRKLLERYGLTHSKRLGQHFLFDRGILERIARCAMPLSEDRIVIEVGPGPCGLTAAILEICKPRRLYCVEKDVSFEKLHRDFAADHPGKLEFIYGDALDIRPQSLTSNQNFSIIANLPYNVGTKLLTNWILDPVGIGKMTLMFQKEVANRINAAIGTKAYGRLSVISQLFCEIERLFDVPAGAFYPMPKVDSTVINLVPKRTELTTDDINRLQNLTENCFQKRRKMIHTILKSKYPEPVIKETLAQCNITPTMRPEEITPSQFLRLVRHIFRDLALIKN